MAEIEYKGRKEELPMESAADDTIRLVKLAKEGDVEAFRLLYEHIYKDLYRYALSVMKDSFDAEDVVSETVLAAYRQIGKLKDESAFRSWMFVILNNKCKRMYRGKHYDECIENADIPAPDNMENNLIVRMQYEELDYEARVVIALSVFAGFSSNEIAKMLHKRPGSVRSIKSRALTRLKNQLERKGIYESR